MNTFCMEIPIHQISLNRLNNIEHLITCFTEQQKYLFRIYIKNIQF